MDRGMLERRQDNPARSERCRLMGKLHAVTFRA